MERRDEEGLAVWKEVFPLTCNTSDGYVSVIKILSGRAALPAAERFRLPHV